MVHYFESPVDEYDDRKNRSTHDKDPDADADNQQPQPTDPQNNDSESDDELERPPNFPHAPLPPDTATGKSAYPAGVKRANLARQHFNVLNTILHKSLLEQDFARASRAFALLLRVRVAGRRVDLRKKGIWGIGAEILLRQPQEDGVDLVSDNVDGIEEDEIAKWLSDEGFTAARAYYDRLILQYPFRKIRPGVISAKHFYPAMFGLWIFQVQTESKRAVKLLDNASDVESAVSDVSFSSNFGGLRSGAAKEDLDKSTKLQDIKTHELERASTIASRLAEVTFLPPLDRDAELLKLRGMVSLWMADLVVAVRPESQVEVEKHRAEARTTLKRAHGRGWEPSADLRTFMEDDGDDDEEMVDDEDEVDY